MRRAPWSGPNVQRPRSLGHPPAQSNHELDENPPHRVTVPEERVPNTCIPENGPTTSGGGSQVVTDDPVPVAPDEIVPLDDPIIFNIFP